jgi:hypothetical protein
MHDSGPAIPTPVTRRLVLNLLGFRLRHGHWHAPHGGQMFSEAQLDALSDEAFDDFLWPWWGSACASALN